MADGVSFETQIEKIKIAEAKEKNTNVSDTNSTADNNNSVFVEKTNESDTTTVKISEKKENEVGQKPHHINPLSRIIHACSMRAA